MKRQRPGGNSLASVAAAVVGSAAAWEAAAGPCCPDHEEVEAVQCCDRCPDVEVLYPTGSDVAQDVFTAANLIVGATGGGHEIWKAENGDVTGSPMALAQVATAYLVDEVRRLRARAAELEQAAPTAAMDVHAALNTYEVAAGTPEGVTAVYDYGPDAQQLIVGANQRKLIARRTAEGTWLGGCLITDPAVAARLSDFLTGGHA